MSGDAAAMTCKVSVVIPNYNYGRFIAGAIDSVLMQKGVDVDVVVVDDGSSDDSLEVLGAYRDKIRIFRQQHGGAAQARNRGIREASGEFITFLDADDWLLEDSLYTRCQFLKAHPQFDWVYGARKVANASGEIIGTSEEYFAHADGILQGDVTGSLIASYAGIHPMVALFYLADVRAVGGFCEKYRKFEDYDFLLRMASGKRVGFCPAGHVAVQRLHESPLSLDYELGYRSQLQLLKAYRRTHRFDARLRRVFRDRISDIHNHLACLYSEKGMRASALASALFSLAYKPVQKVAYRFLFFFFTGRSKRLAEEIMGRVYMDKGAGIRRGQSVHGDRPGREAGAKKS